MTPPPKKRSRKTKEHRQMFLEKVNNTWSELKRPCCYSFEKKDLFLNTDTIQKIKQKLNCRHTVTRHENHVTRKMVCLGEKAEFRDEFSSFHMHAIQKTPGSKEVTLFVGESRADFCYVYSWATIFREVVMPIKFHHVASGKEHYDKCMDHDAGGLSVFIFDQDFRLLLTPYKAEKNSTYYCVFMKNELVNTMNIYNLIRSDIRFFRYGTNVCIRDGGNLNFEECTKIGSIMNEVNYMTKRNLPSYCANLDVYSKDKTVVHVMCYGDIDNVLGFIFVDYDKNRRYFHTFVVGPKSWGLGSKLLKHVIELEKTDSCFIELAVDFFNKDRLIKFYQRHGFIVCDDQYPVKMIHGVSFEKKKIDKRLSIKSKKEYFDHRIDTYVSQLGGPEFCKLCPPYEAITNYLSSDKPFSKDWIIDAMYLEANRYNCITEFEVGLMELRDCDRSLHRSTKVIKRQNLHLQDHIFVYFRRHIVLAIKDNNGDCMILNTMLNTDKFELEMQKQLVIEAWPFVFDSVNFFHADFQNGNNCTQISAEILDMWLESKEDGTVFEFVKALQTKHKL